MKEQPTKQHILISTIDAIEKHGLHNLTTRLIAEEAGVNNAALHYYFGTKEHLVAEALTMTMQHWVDDSHEILSRPSDLRTRLEELLNFVAEGSIKYPNIIRAHLYNPLMNGISEGPFLKLYGSWLDRVSAELTAVQPGRDADRIRFAIHSAAMGLMMAALLQEIPDAPPGLDLHDAAYRRGRIRQIINILLDAQLSK